MAVDERREQSTVDEARYGHVIGLGREHRDRLVTVPAGLDLVPVRVETPAAVAVAQLVRIMIAQLQPTGGLEESRDSCKSKKF